MNWSHKEVRFGQIELVENVSSKWVSTNSVIYLAKILCFLSITLVLLNGPFLPGTDLARQATENYFLTVM